MFLYKILPLTYLPSSHPQILDYFSSQKINWGSLVTIPLGKKLINGLVLEFQILPPKIQIKKADFLLKPIKKIIINRPILTEKQWQLINWLTEYYFLPLSGLTRLALPLSIIKKLSQEILPASSTIIPRENFYLFHEDFDFLISKINFFLAHHQQILFIFPNQIQLENYFRKLKIFEKEIVIYNRQTPSKKLLKIYQEINQGKKNIIFGCRSVVFAPFSQLGLIVVVEEENPALETWEGKIHFSAKIAAEKLAELFQSSLILISENPSLESWLALKNKKFQTRGNIIDSLNSKKIEFFEIRNQKNSVLFHPQIIEAITNLQKKQNPKIIIFNNRRGLAPALLCKDCGYLFKCPHCDVCLVYHQTNTPFLLCHHCGFEMIPPEFCPICRSYLIKFLGTGTEKILKELKTLFPQLKIKCFDSDHLKNLQEEKKTFSQFDKGEIQILITTELIFKFLPQLSSFIDLGILFSTEQILIFPDYRVEERLKRIIQKLSSVSQKLFIQTFDLKREIFQKLENPFQFYEKELKLREQFFYPPFSEIIKIIIKNKKETETKKIANECFKILKEKIGDYFEKNFYQLTPPLPLSPFKLKDYFLQEIILKLKRNETSIQRRNQLLRLLPQKIIIKVNPYD